MANNFILELPLNSKSFELDVLNKRFRIAERMYNKLLSIAVSRLNNLKKNNKYKYYLKLYSTTKDAKLKKEYSFKLYKLRKSFKLTEYDLQAFGVLLQRKYKKNIDSNTMQKLATAVYDSIKDNLFKKGKKVHFKKFNTLTSIEGKSNNTGIKFRDNYLEWNKLHISTYIKENDYYVYEALENKVKYCRIVRKPFNKGYKYYIQLVFGGIPPSKHKKDTKIVEVPNNKRVGIDIGTSTIAVCSNKKLILTELAPNINIYNKKIKEIQVKMDNSKRILNPNKYKENGVINKGNKDKWVFSKNYSKLRWRLKNLYRKKSAYIKTSHNTIANEIVGLGTDIYVETMNFNGLAKRGKKLERSTKLSVIKIKVNVKENDKNKIPKFNKLSIEPKEIKEINSIETKASKISIESKEQKNYKEVYKYKKKKRFGKSINNRAPALLIRVIDRKLGYIDKSIKKVKTMSFRASQYNHIEDTYVKKDLKTRWNKLNGELIQRDLYSAFLIQNSCKSLEKTDRDLCTKGYEEFKSMHNLLIEELKTKKVKNKNFGL